MSRIKWKYVKGNERKTLFKQYLENIKDYYIIVIYIYLRKIS